MFAQGPPPSAFPLFLFHGCSHTIPFLFSPSRALLFNSDGHISPHLLFPFLVARSCCAPPFFPPTSLRTSSLLPHRPAYFSPRIDGWNSTTFLRRLPVSGFSSSTYPLHHGSPTPNMFPSIWRYHFRPLPVPPLPQSFPRERVHLGTIFFSGVSAFEFVIAFFRPRHYLHLRPLPISPADVPATSSS